FQGSVSALTSRSAAPPLGCTSVITFRSGGQSPLLSLYVSAARVRVLICILASLIFASSWGSSLVGSARARPRPKGAPGQLGRTATAGSPWAGGATVPLSVNPLPSQPQCLPVSFLTLARRGWRRGATLPIAGASRHRDWRASCGSRRGVAGACRADP